MKRNTSKIMDDKPKSKIPGTLTVDEAMENLKNNLCDPEEREYYKNFKTILDKQEKPKSKIQELHDINGTIYNLIEHLHSLDVPLGLVFQKLRETTTEIQGAITKLLGDEVQGSYGNATKLDESEIPKIVKKQEIIVEFDTKKK